MVVNIILTGGDPTGPYNPASEYSVTTAGVSARVPTIDGRLCVIRLLESPPYPISISSTLSPNGTYQLCGTSLNKAKTGQDQEVYLFDLTTKTFTLVTKHASLMMGVWVSPSGSSVEYRSSVSLGGAPTPVSGTVFRWDRSS